MSGKIRTWERRQNESIQAYEAFAAYRDMGANRSIRAVARTLNKSVTLIGRWSSGNAWEARARAWDDYIDDRLRRKELKQHEEMAARHIDIAMRLQEKAQDALKALDAKAMQPKDIKEFIKIATELERISRGAGEKTDDGVIITLEGDAQEYAG